MPQVKRLPHRQKAAFITRFRTNYPSFYSSFPTWHFVSPKFMSLKLRAKNFARNYQEHYQIHAAINSSRLVLISTLCLNSVARTRWSNLGYLMQIGSRLFVLKRNFSRMETVNDRIKSRGRWPIRAKITSAFVRRIGKGKSLVRLSSLCKYWTVLD